MWVSQLERRKAPGDLRGILLVRHVARSETRDTLAPLDLQAGLLGWRTTLNLSALQALQPSVSRPTLEGPRV